MIDMKYLTWALVPPFIFLGLLFISIVAYAYAPQLAAASLGPEAGPSPCKDKVSEGNVTLNQSEVKVQQEIARSCESMKSLTSLMVMIMTVLTLAFGMLPMIIITLDILQSETMGRHRKIAWLAVTWLLLGFFAAIAYYFIEKKGD